MLIKAVEDSNYQDGAIIDSLGWLYFKKGEMQLAEKWITDAYKLEPSEPEIIDHLSQVYKKQGRNKEAKFLDNKILLFHQDYFKIDEIKERNENT
jgi:Tfp pilus assembly protein PilF